MRMCFEAAGMYVLMLYFDKARPLEDVYASNYVAETFLYTHISRRYSLCFQSVPSSLTRHIDTVTVSIS